MVRRTKINNLLQMENILCGLIIYSKNIKNKLRNWLKTMKINNLLIHFCNQTLKVGY